MRLRQIALVARSWPPPARTSRPCWAWARPTPIRGCASTAWPTPSGPVGDTFLEVVSPTQAGTTAGRLLDKRHGDGGYMAIFQADDITEARARVAAHDVRIVDQADRDGVHMTHLHPKDLGGAIVSIDAMTPKERWEWGGPHWTQNIRTEVSLGIVGAELQGDDPDGMSRRWPPCWAGPDPHGGRLAGGAGGRRAALS